MENLILKTIAKQFEAGTLTANTSVSINAVLHPLNIGDAIAIAKDGGTASLKRVIRFTNVQDSGSDAVASAVSRVTAYGDTEGKSETLQLLSRIALKSEAVNVCAVIEFRIAEGEKKACVSLQELAVA